MSDQPKPHTSTPCDEPVPVRTRVQPDNPVGSLYKLALRQKLPVPKYEHLNVSGPPHHLTFVWACSFMGRRTTGSGRTCKDARLDAATSMISRIHDDGLPPRLQRAKKSTGPDCPTRHTVFTLIF